MRILRPLFPLLLALSAAFDPRARAQQAIQPHIGYAFPAGGQKGSTFKVLIGGQNIEGVSDVLVTGGGFSATVLEQYKPLSNKEYNLLKDQLQALREKKRAAQTVAQANPQASNTAAPPSPQKEMQPQTQVFTAEDQKLLDDLALRVSKYERRPANANLADTVTLQVTLSPEAKTGDRELRLMTKAGLTNPLLFQVGELPETSEQANDKTPGTKAPVEITLPRTINGQILPGAADRYRFTAAKGQRIVVAVFARALIPYLADAVPGWFQATLSLYDATGKEVAYDDDYHFNPDPVIAYTIPRDGAYEFEIKDAIYRGREDFVYRICVGELPFVTGIFPLGAQAGVATSVRVSGWNLPGNRLTATVADPGLHQLTARKGELVPNRAAFLVDTLPELEEREPNDNTGQAQALTLPAIINGHIGKPGDFDVFSFQGKAGASLVAEVQARRLDSPVDSNLTLLDATGRVLAFNDDHEDKGSGLNTHHADSYLAAKLPADGIYYVKIGDTQQGGGPEYAYRLRIAPPRPDFDLRVVPSSANMRSGGTMTLTVYALRRDGFDGDIAFGIKDAPLGFALSGGRIPSGREQVRVTLAAPNTTFNGPVSLSFQGAAEIEGRKVVHEAVPAEDMMQAFLYRHLVPSQRFVLALVGRSPLRQPVQYELKHPLRIPAGGNAVLKVDVPANLPRGKVRLALSDPPAGVELAEVKETWGGATELVFACDKEKVRTGLKGNLIVELYLDREPVAKPKAKGAAKRANNAPVDLLPAIPFEIVTQ